MSNTPHTLQEEFPGDLDKLHELKVSNTRFAKLLEDYDEVNDKVHRAESRLDLMSDSDEETLRKQRSRIKDDIARMLRA
ncbi:MAG: DUF465 domain-containing protein [Paracoccaceae bacterium]